MENQFPVLTQVRNIHVGTCQKLYQFIWSHLNRKRLHPIYKTLRKIISSPSNMHALVELMSLVDEAPR